MVRARLDRLGGRCEGVVGIREGMMAMVVNGEAIPCHRKLRLDPSKPFVVTVHAQPRTSGIRIRGYLHDSTIGIVEVIGSQIQFELPFVKPEIYIEQLPGLESFQIGQGPRNAPLQRL